jgi:uncharacterized protein YukE
MSSPNLTMKAYEEKIQAQLQQAKSQIEELEARAKGKAAQAQIDVINQLKTKHQEIDKKRQELKTVSDAKVDQVKAEIDTHVTKLKSSLAELATKLKEPQAKAG